MRLGRRRSLQELIAEFFPPEREEPTFGVEVEVETLESVTTGRLPGGRFKLAIDELPAPPDADVVERMRDALVGLAELLDGRPVVRADVAVTRNLTDRERYEDEPLYQLGLLSAEERRNDG